MTRARRVKEVKLTHCWFANPANLPVTCICLKQYILIYIYIIFRLIIYVFYKHISLNIYSIYIHNILYNMILKKSSKTSRESIAMVDHLDTVPIYQLQPSTIKNKGSPIKVKVNLLSSKYR